MCSCVPSQIQYALADLPDTLDETYQRTLRNINNAHWEFAHRLFQFVAVASRPLRVEELAELLAFDFEAGPIPKFDEDCRLEDPIDAVLSTCSSLLAIVDGEYGVGKVIQFSHFSVKEYLTSPRLAEANDIIPRRYHVSMTPAHTLAAQICLGILLHLDKDVVTRENLEKWPLAKYAAKHWADHALFEGVSQNVEDGLKQLFDPGKSHLVVCVWIQNPRWNYDIYDERPLSPLRTSLHYAAYWGLHFMVEFLVIECSQDVRLRGFYDNVTPLHLASERGHLKTSRMLIEHGAGVMAQNKDRKTPLHLASRAGQVEVAGVLIEHGADVTAQNKDGKTPLHLAVTSGKKELDRMLIEHGADVTAQSMDGETPLHLAVKWGQKELVRMPIERGADVTAQNMDGETPLHLAAKWGQKELVRMLIERGADVTAQNEDGAAPLHLAAKWGQNEPICMLIERGADVEVQTNDGDTPLLLALSPDPHSGDVEMEAVHTLIESGADVAAQNKKGETPLHLASRPNLNSYKLEELAEVSRILLEQGADVNAKNNAGFTPLRLASQSRHLSDTRAQVLLQHGADPGTGEDFIFDLDSDPETDSDSDSDPLMDPDQDQDQDQDPEMDTDSD